MPAVTSNAFFENVIVRFISFSLIERLWMRVDGRACPDLYFGCMELVALLLRMDDDSASDQNVFDGGRGRALQEMRFAVEGDHFDGSVGSLHGNGLVCDLDNRSHHMREIAVSDGERTE